VNYFIAIEVIHFQKKKRKMKKTIIYILSTSFLFSCFNISEIGEYEDNSPIKNEIIFNTKWKKKSIIYNREVVNNNDTLVIKSLEYLISDLTLTSDSDTIKIGDYKVVNLNNANSNIFSFDSIKENTYNLSFNFGLANIDKEYTDLNAQNFNTKDGGYYFIKFELDHHESKSTVRKIYFDIAKKGNNTVNVNSFKVNIKGFQIKNSTRTNQALINLNLNNLFTNPNSIDIKDLNSYVIDNDQLQTKMIENAKNIFYLDKFIHL
jgi:hypothetical protein